MKMKIDGAILVVITDMLSTATIIAILVNTINFSLLVVWPVSKRVQLWYWLHKYHDKIEFRREFDIAWPKDDVMIFDEINKHYYIKCMIPISKNRYLLWKIKENGEIITKPFNEKIKFFRENLHLWQKKDTKEGVVDGVLDDYIIPEKLCRYYVLRFFTKKLLRYYTDEHYVMAKLSGIHEI